MMNAKDFLKRPIQLKFNIDILADTITILECQAENMTAVLSHVPGGKGQNKDFSATVDRIVEMRKKLAQMNLELTNAIIELETVIERIPCIREKAILKKQYLENKTLKQIAVELNYSYQTARELHSKGVKEVQKIINKKEEQ